ncbi:Copper-fist domain-containing protein [Mycena kentingensis (nom. inval.)]|nr:Copper-fist domain-containing protein [Mycena kentingensis (nom. inval.)]
MVFVNSKKFACESCIKGHRSSSCHHTERPLFEIKKKGRPVSQCPKCRELRQSRRVHSKCQCPQEEQPSRGILLPSSSSKSRRYIPIAPALPNGLRDALPPLSPRSQVPPDSRQRVDSLLNPCNCRSGFKCKCRADDASRPGAGLDALANAAAAACCAPAPAPSTSKRQTSRPNSPTHKRSKHKHSHAQRAPPGPALPPLLYSDSSPSPTIPTFGTIPMPPMSTITSLAGSGCTCGLECACPGCVEHRGPEHADPTRASCADGCGTCVDSNAGVGLPLGGALAGYGYAFSLEGDTNASSPISQFLARAAALPRPPSPRNPKAAPVNLPKLECCGGNCACPEGSCACGKSCDGCCTEHRARSQPEPAKRDHPVVPVPPVPVVSAPPAPAPSPARRSCCAARS